MATATQKPPKADKPEGFGGFIQNIMGASKEVSLTAVNLPFMFLEGLGVPEEKTAGLKNFNTKFVTGVYRGPDWVVEKLSGRKTEEKPPEKVEKKAEKKAAPKKAPKKAAKAIKDPPKVAAKKAPKKAAKAKKQPPKVAAKKPAPVDAATKEAA